MIELVLFDMDGLSSKWRTRIIDKYVPHMTIDELNKHTDKGNIIRSIYDKEPDFFLNLEIIPDFLELFEGVRELGLPIGWLTAIDQNHRDTERVKSNKWNWVKENIDKRYGTSTRFQMVFVDESADKAMYAEPTYCLIDDYYQNCNGFIAAGGKAICVGEDDAYDAQDVLHQLKELM
ncbi:hypothetical protein GR7B_00203 [Vibrio phage vB_VcorM_GR7B]|nr:hypothetical protein GR7B_00203 [Vibrio phage vB_VcorM_GR7B]